MVIKSFQMPIGNGHWESNFFNVYFSPIVVEKDIALKLNRHFKAMYAQMGNEGVIEQGVPFYTFWNKQNQTNLPGKFE